MRIDESHRAWAVASGVILAIAIIIFVPYYFFLPGGAGGGTWPGLLYGVAGYGMMLYAGLMGARKKKPLWRVGRAQTWMRGHLWLGALSLPMILMHSAFSVRGPLTIVLMTLLVITVLSGITGALLQHFMPKRLTASVQLETIYEQIAVVREQLRQEASEIVLALCSAAEPGAMGAAAGAPAQGYAASVVTADVPASELTAIQKSNLRSVYDSGILPYLRNPDNPRSALAGAVKAKPFFDALRRQLPESVHESVTDLENICEEERQLTAQRRKYLLLHSWLLVHVPLSITLLILGGVHALVAIRY